MISWNEVYARDGAFTYTLHDLTMTLGSMVFGLATIYLVLAHGKPTH